MFKAKTKIIFYCRRCGAWNRCLPNEPCIICGCRERVDKYKDTRAAKKRKKK